MIKEADIKTFVLEDLVGRKVEIGSFKSEGIELIVARDLKTGDIFVLKENRYPVAG